MNKQLCRQIFLYIFWLINICLSLSDKATGNKIAENLSPIYQIVLKKLYSKTQTFMKNVQCMDH